MDIFCKIRGKALPNIGKLNTDDASQKDQESSHLKSVENVSIHRPTQRESPEKDDQNEGNQNLSESHVTESEDSTPKKDKNLLTSKTQDDLGESKIPSIHGPTNVESPEENVKNDEDESNKQVKKSNDTNNEDDPSKQEHNHSPPGNADNLSDKDNSNIPMGAISKASEFLDADPLTVQHSNNGSNESVHIADGLPTIIRRKHSLKKLPGQRVRQKTTKRSNTLKEIRKLQSSWNLLIPRLPFQRLVREIMQEYKNDYRMQSAAVGALHESAEYMLVELFEESMELVVHRNVKTLLDKDYRLAKNIRKRYDRSIQ